MKHLFTIYRQSDIHLSGTVLFRKAYRAIVIQESKVLLIKSKKYGEFKFPGDGKEAHEDAYHVVKRETLEETGYMIKRRIIPYGLTLEYAKDFFEGKFDVFKQESRYYLCKVHPIQSEISLLDYEIEYGYEPFWVSLEEAIQNNESVPSNDLIPWKERDTQVMKLMLEKRDSD